MKYFTFLFCILSAIASKAQFIDITQADTSQYWLAAHDNTSLSGTTHSETAEHFSGRDTMLRGFQYWQTENGLQTQLIRTDAQHRVYGLDPNDTIETLYFAFDAQVGDTIRFRGFIGDSTRQVRDFFYAVDSIDSVDVGGSQRRAVHVNTNIPSPSGGDFALTWIEGVGEQYYGLHSVFVSDLYNGFSFCGIHTDTGYIYTAYNSCYILLPVSDVAAGGRIRMYPTPAGNTLTIENNTGDMLRDYKLVDLSGRVVYSGPFAGDGHTIALGDTPSGMYFLIMSDDRGHSYKQKLVKR